jgi:hypothetical protein
VGEYLHPPVEEGYSWGQVRVVHFTAVLTAMSQGLLRTPNEELKASSAGVNKHQCAVTGKPPFFGNNTWNEKTFLAKETFSSFHLNPITSFTSILLCFLHPLSTVYIYMFISFSMILFFFLSLNLYIILSFILHHITYYPGLNYPL